MGGSKPIIFPNRPCLWFTAGVGRERFPVHQSRATGQELEGAHWALQGLAPCAPVILRHFPDDRRVFRMPPQLVPRQHLEPGEHRPPRDSGGLNAESGEGT